MSGSCVQVQKETGVGKHSYFGDKIGVTKLISWLNLFLYLQVLPVSHLCTHLPHCHHVLDIILDQARGDSFKYSHILGLVSNCWIVRNFMKKVLVIRWSRGCINRFWYLSSNFYLLILGLQGFYLLILGSKYILYQMVEGLREQVLKSLIVAIFFCWS